jgi:hypothetical protein
MKNQRKGWAGALERDRLRALLEASLQADFFGGSPHRRAGSSLATAAAFQAVIGVLVGAVLYLGLSPFALLVSGMSLVAIVAALALGPDSASLLRGTVDEAVGALPFREATARAARALHAAAYLVLGTAGAAIPIAVFAGAATGSAKVGLATFFAALHQSAVFAAATAGMEALLGRTRLGARLRPLVSFGLGVLLVAALLAGIRPLPELERLISGAREALVAFPPAWFAAEALALGGQAEPGSADLLGALALGTAAALVLGGVAITSRPIPSEASAPRPGALRKGLARRWVRLEERATFDLTLDLLARERDRAVRAGPIFAFPAALLLTGAVLKDARERELFVHVLLFVSNAVLPAAILLLSRSRFAEARWIFETAPVRSPDALRAGVRKAAVCAIVFPLVGMLVAADVAVRGPSVAALHAPIVLAVSLLVLSRAMRGLPRPYPFSEEPTRFEGGVGEGALGLAFGLTLFGFVEQWLVRDPISALVAAGLLFLAVRWTGRRSR